MESKERSHGKKEDSQSDSLSTYSNSRNSCVHGSLYEFSPHLSRSHKRAKSLKTSFSKANIDFPDLRAPCRYGVPLSPLPEPVEEDASEGSYVVCLLRNRTDSEKGGATDSTTRTFEDSGTMWRTCCRCTAET